MAIIYTNRLTSGNFHYLGLPLLTAAVRGYRINLKTGNYHYLGIPITFHQMPPQKAKLLIINV